LSRALGDFTYKRNGKIPVEEQIVTCDPEIIEHQIAEDDEFIIIACDGTRSQFLCYGLSNTSLTGIWDCLSTQQAANAVRLLISQGKSLSEICETICDHCLAPDTVGGVGIGCDNMTIMIVALLQGKTPEEWQAWVMDRVKNKVGFNTPLELPTLYSASRIEGHRRRLVAWEERQRYWAEKDKEEAEAKAAEETERQKAAGGVTVVIGNDGSADADGGDDDNDSDETETSPIENDYAPVEFPNDPTNSLKAQLDELDREEEERQTKKHKSDPDGASLEERELQGEAPPPPKDAPNGSTVPVQQQAEGLNAQVSPQVAAMVNVSH
jgi:protein phosphatase PTC2/3